MAASINDTGFCASKDKLGLPSSCNTRIECGHQYRDRDWIGPTTSHQKLPTSAAETATAAASDEGKSDSHPCETLLMTLLMALLRHSTGLQSSAHISSVQFLSRGPSCDPLAARVDIHLRRVGPPGKHGSTRYNIISVFAEPCPVGDPLRMVLPAAGTSVVKSALLRQRGPQGTLLTVHSLRGPRSTRESCRKTRQAARPQMPRVVTLGLHHFGLGCALLPYDSLGTPDVSRPDWQL